MSKYRFEVGTSVMCNLGEFGWRLGRIIALNYREDNWPEGQLAPYQVALDFDYSLIYVPKDDDRFCRKATDEDVKISSRSDALAEYNPRKVDNEIISDGSEPDSNLCCPDDSSPLQYRSYRKGRSHCCNDCPKNWLYAELYSEHYRCADRNNLKISHHKIDLGTFKLGESLNYEPDGFLQNKIGFMQAPTLVRLPPGIIFSDDGGLAGEIAYDPNRDSEYDVNFVAASSYQWNDESIGLIRLEIHFTVNDNKPPNNFDELAFEKRQDNARSSASKILESLNKTWTSWEQRQLNNQTTCERMLDDLSSLRELVELHPRLDNGKWWGHLGGYHMNVHKLLENTLFECELYLGYALTFGNENVRFYAEQNLKGCYQKRLLESARFMWYDGIELILQNQWSAAIEIFRSAYAKKEGWGWAVNYGDIWLGEAVALIMNGVEKGISTTNLEELEWFNKANKLVEDAVLRAKNSGVFGPEGHPWISEVSTALESIANLISNGKDISSWLDEFSSRTVYWCSQVLAGVFPFPPRERTRLASESVLIENLPGFNLLQN